MRSSYDYIIVGAGSAGCALAHRLSARPELKVLLLEAGPSDRNRLIALPPGFVKLFKTEYDWAFKTAPERHCSQRELYWPRGKVLGGSSALNAQLYIRGHRRDYDRWRDLGNPGWGFADVLPYFRRAEDQEAGASEYHGVGGPLRVENRRYANPLSLAFLEACAEVGWPNNPDFNGAEQLGYGLYQVTQRRGIRCSAAKGYLEKISSRPNLEVVTGAHVLKIEMTDGRAEGVELLIGGARLTVKAEREVILSAGAIGSPQLLLLSGIGKADELKNLGIAVTLDAPGVGRNLQDHPVISLICRSRFKNSLDSAETLLNLLRYLIFRRGPFTSTVCEAGAFVKTQDHLAQPDLQFHFVPAGLKEHGFVQAADQGFNIGPTLIKPLSRGSIKLMNADPLAAPRIEANYLAEPKDLELLVQGLKLARELSHTRAFAHDLDFEVFPGKDVISNADLEAYVRNNVETLYHPAGTCAMGPEGRELEPSGSLPVVDANLCVHGIAGLRVVDASVMPELIGGNTNAPTIMIAEKAADLILGT